MEREEGLWKSTKQAEGCVRISGATQVNRELNIASLAPSLVGEGEENPHPNVVCFPLSEWRWEMSLQATGCLKRISSRKPEERSKPTDAHSSLNWGGTPVLGICTLAPQLPKWFGDVYKV